MLKIKNAALLEALKTQAENAAVFAIDNDTPSQTVTLGKDVVLEEVAGNNGKYHRVVAEIDGLGKPAITVRGDAKDSDTFKLQVYRAIRDVPANGGRRAITAGEPRVYAIPV